MYPNNVLSAWQMTLMIAVPLTVLIGWVIAVFIADRAPRATDVAASASAPKTVAFPASPAQTSASPAQTAPDQPDVPAPLAA
jgi:hypothetical protein